MVREALTTLIQRDNVILIMEMEIQLPSKAWDALARIAVETRDNAYNQAKNGFDFT